MNAKVLLFTKVPDETGPCPFCIKAKEFLKQKDVPYEETILDKKERQRFYDEHGLEGSDRTVPQVFVQLPGEPAPDRIGGFRELENSGIASLFHPNVSITYVEQVIHDPTVDGRIVFGEGDLYTLFNNKEDLTHMELHDGTMHPIPKGERVRFIRLKGGWAVHEEHPIVQPEPAVEGPPE